MTSAHFPSQADATREGGRVLRITEYGEPILHRPTAVVSEFGVERWGSTLADMFQTLRAARGVGLSANQVGMDVRLFVYDLVDEQGRHRGAAFNPAIEIVGSQTSDEDAEGCLSIPGPRAAVDRPTRVILRASDLSGQPIRVEARGYLARCFQHETQHLLGHLYVDLLDADARRRVLAEYRTHREEALDERRAHTVELGLTPPAYPAQPPHSAPTSWITNR